MLESIDTINTFLKRKFIDLKVDWESHHFYNDLHEIFEQVSKESSPTKKIEILQENDSQGLQVFLRCVFDDNIAWLVPDSKPPYEPSDAPE